jgi:hypothetical protein
VNRLARIQGRLSARVDIAWLVAFRVLFGTVMCVSMLRFIGYGWIDDLFVEPSFHFKYWGFAFVEPLPHAQMHALFWGLAAAALAIALGICFRLSAALFVIGFTYLQLVDVTTYLNHYYLAGLLGVLLALSPAHRAFSLDARIARAIRGSPAGVATGQQISISWLYAFRFQVAVVYTFAGIAKAHPDWLIHAQPLRIWLGAHADLPLLGVVFRTEWAALAMSWAGFLFDTTIAWVMMIPRARPLAYAVIIVFHGLTSLLFPIGMFPVIMVLSALVFFSPSWPRALLRLTRRADLLPDAAPATPAPAGVARRWWLVPATAYCALQLLVPLRFLAYGGNVRWHEQGMRFSWRVMVREKNGSVTFLVKSRRSARVWHVNPSTYLTRLQEREMAGQPDLILQLAHHIRDDFSRRHGPVEVRVDAFVSLNGRRIARLIDPNVDLARVKDGLAPAEWILPAPADPPPHLRVL